MTNTINPLTPPGWRPWAVGAARGALLAVLAVIIPYLIDLLTTTEVPTELRVWVPIILIVLRSIEGIADTRLTNGERQASLLKGGRLTK